MNADATPINADQCMNKARRTHRQSRHPALNGFICVHRRALIGVHRRSRP